MLSKEKIVSLLNVQGNNVLDLMKQANSLRKTHVITFSKNVFLPLTNICRNDCGYCTFRRDPEAPDAKLVLTPLEVMNTIRKADTYQCKEALCTFGEQADTYPQPRHTPKK